ncbi:ISAs1 family transposase [Salmonella enterica subsp. salamae]|uniref:ISAs1 family transposase n=1 Tax=Salmonella enterica subsp. salamae TaxID=59202 RepID=A0A5Y3V0G7_SALER|nr:ISAs1 family transposase [Salmonella enterica subsp. salamae]EEO8344375.1 ISAs1 family transposase [Salmonella enterica]ECI3450677.1 ISAs1 family transposase [Salmonella enterica subsp. salamae]ECJ2325618.1 ISAs1 family transposase [Salmonella enterica subsp. salamae]EIC8291983.1 ISAs1 family transposase [Salmonella enterica]
MYGSIFLSGGNGEKKEPEMWVRYYISSASLTVKKFTAIVRSHWCVENKLHWCLNGAMNEYDCRIRRGNAAALFSGLRHVATKNKEFKAGLKRKMRRSARDRESLASVLADCGIS